MRENRVSASKSLNTEKPLIFADIVIMSLQYYDSLKLVGLPHFYKTESFCHSQNLHAICCLNCSFYYHGA